MKPEIRSLDADALRTYMASRKEGEYALIDVRQPQEYERGHIPGARLVPLPELLEGRASFEPDLPHIFYCRSGSRSARAARHVQENALVGREIHNLRGGIMAWDGVAVEGVPNIRVFDTALSLRETLLTAMNLEKGAQRLYESIRAATDKKLLCALMEKLAPMEAAHAKILYDRLLAAPETADAPPLPAFDELYASMAGDILEGGKSVPDLAPWIERAGRGDCMELAELALEMENSAFDLYRTLAEQAATDQERQTYLWLAEQEKAHERFLLKHMDAFV